MKQKLLSLLLVFMAMVALPLNLRAQYATTMYVPYEMEPPAGYHAYTVTGVSGEYLILQRHSGMIMANSPVILSEFDYYAPSSEGTNYLQGVTFGTDVFIEPEYDYYELQDYGIEVIWSKIQDHQPSFLVDGGKAYLAFPKEISQGREILRMPIDPISIMEAAWGSSGIELVHEGTFAEAIAAAQAANSTVGYIRLNSSITLSEVCHITKGNFTIDLNGCAITATDCAFRIEQAGTRVSFVDSSSNKNGSVSATQSAVEVNKASVSIGAGAYEGGTVVSVGTAPSSVTISGGSFTSSRLSAVNNLGSLIISGGTFAAGSDYAVYADAASESTVIKGGNFVVGGHSRATFGYFGSAIDLTGLSQLDGLTVWNEVQGEVALGAQTVAIPEGYSIRRGDGSVAESFTNVEAYTITRNPHIVRFDAKGGEGYSAPWEVAYGATFTLPVSGPGAPSGKLFKAWSIDGVEYTPGTSIQITSDVYVKAVWANRSDYIFLNMTHEDRLGWQGNHIVIKKDGQEIGTAAVADWEREETAKFEYDETAEYTFHWMRAAGAEACTFNITVGDETMYAANFGDCTEWANDYNFYTLQPKNRIRKEIRITDYAGYTDLCKIVVHKDNQQIGEVAISGSQNVTTFDYDSSSEYTFYWKSGNHSFCGDASFDIVVGGDTVVYAPRGSARNYTNGQLLYNSRTKEVHAMYIYVYTSDGNYKDGWGGNAIVVKKDGAEIGRATLEYGSRSNTDVFEYDPNSEYTFYWHQEAGVGNHYMYISIKGTVVMEATFDKLGAYTHGQLIYPVAAAPEDISNKVVVNMTDNYGDGWNGNAIVVKKNNEVVGTATVSEGKAFSLKLDYDANATYSYHWQKGESVDECAFEIMEGGDTLLSVASPECLNLEHDQQIYPVKEEEVVPTTIQISVADSYGDGWNGNAIVVKKNGEEMGEVTLGNGATGWAEFEYDKTAEYSFYWADSDYSDECSFQIIICGDTLLNASTSNSAAYKDGQLLAVSTPQPAYATKLVVNMADSYGDGWWGVALIVKKDGVEVSQVTLDNGRSGSAEVEVDFSGTYTFHWKKDYYAEECSFDIVLGNKVLFSASESDCGSFENDQNVFTLSGDNVLVLEDGKRSVVLVTEEKEYALLAYTRTLPNMTWNALYVPFEIPVESLGEDYDVAYVNDVRSYDMDDNGTIDNMEMEVIRIKSGTLKANHPYLIRAKSAAAQNMNLMFYDAMVYRTAPEHATVVNCSSAYTYFEVAGTYETKTAEQLEGCYAINFDGAWSPVATGSVLKPFRLYMTITDRNGSPVKVESSAATKMNIRLFGEDSLTGIDEVPQAPHADREATVYDLMGRKVLSPQKGRIYVVNGKKVMWK